MSKKIAFVKFWDFIRYLKSLEKKNAHLPKMSILFQFGREMLALLCSDDHTNHSKIRIYQDNKLQKFYKFLINFLAIHYP